MPRRTRSTNIHEVDVIATKGKPSAPEERVSRTVEQPGAAQVEDRKRREVIKKIAVGGAALAGCTMLPERWATPLIEFGALPAHATTSGLLGEILDAVDEAKAKAEESASDAKEADSASPEVAETSSPPEEAAAEAEPAASEWTVIQWGGNPNETSESRDRTWWTKIHGSSCDHWHRKFPLPRWIDDSPRRIDFEFSHGATFAVSDSTRMHMDPTGPKYVPEEHGETDPNKQHPKIGAERGTSPNWVRFRVS